MCLSSSHQIGRTVMLGLFVLAGAPLATLSSFSSSPPATAFFPGHQDHRLPGADTENQEWGDASAPAEKPKGMLSTKFKTPFLNKIDKVYERLWKPWF